MDVTELPTGQLEVRRRQAGPGRRRVARRHRLVRVAVVMVDLTVEGQPPELGAIASGHRSYVRVESERQRAAAAARKSGQASSDKTIKSPMPGRVIRMLVAGRPRSRPADALRDRGDEDGERGEGEGRVHRRRGPRHRGRDGRGQRRSCSRSRADARSEPPALFLVHGPTPISASPRSTRSSARRSGSSATTRPATSPTEVAAGNTRERPRMANRWISSK